MSRPHRADAVPPRSSARHPLLFVDLPPAATYYVRGMPGSSSFIGKTISHFRIQHFVMFQLTGGRTAAASGPTVALNWIDQARQLVAAGQNDAAK
jgi:hypothetical protein